MATGNSGVLDGTRRITGKFRDLTVDGDLPGAPLGFRLRGATSYGPPSKGTWRPGDTVPDRTGAIWTATGGGTPGAWAGTAPVLAPSGDTTGAKDAANILGAASFVPSTGGVIRLAPIAQWYVECGKVSINRSGLYIDAAGCWINAVGAGDVLRMFDSSTYLARTVRGGGILGWPTIDGTDTTGNSSAWHAGDILALRSEVQAQNFTAGTTSKLFWFDNQNYWTEWMTGSVYGWNGTAHVVFDIASGAASTASGSFDRPGLDMFLIQGTATQDGVVFQNGAHIDDAGPGLTLAGNFVTESGTPTSAALRITGSVAAGHPDTGIYSHIADCALNIGVECDGSGGQTGPISIAFGSTSNYIAGCYGVMDWEAAGLFFQAAVNASASNFIFSGPILGDTVLSALPQFLGPNTNATADGAITIIPGHGIGIYSSALTAMSYVVPNIAATGGHTPCMGGAGGNGFGISGNSADTGAVAFAVQNGDETGYGLGNCGLTLLDNDTLVSFKNTLDDGSGNMTLAGKLALAAGGTALTPLQFQSGTLNTPAAAGAVEFDGTAYYATAQASSRQVIPAEQFQVLSSPHTLAANTTAQAIFNATTSGAVTVAGSATYFFECLLDVTALSSSSHNVAFAFGGAATYNSLMYNAVSASAAGGTAVSVIGTSAGSTNLFPAGVTGTVLQSAIKGTLRVNGGGAIIPQLLQVTADAAASVAANSYFRIWPAGGSAVTNVGDWS